MNEWLEKLSKMDVGGGDFLTLANGFEYIFSIKTEIELREVEKTYEGKPSGTKFQWRCNLFDLKIEQPVLSEALKLTNLKKHEKIMSIKKGQDYILEIPKGASRDLAEFLLKQEKKDILISMIRTGEKNTTKYNFKLAILEAPEEKVNKAGEHNR